MKHPRLTVILLSMALLLVAMVARAQVFTLNIGSGALPPVPLVNHGDAWRYHYGTNAPGIGWQTLADAALDPVLWGSGPGGFGYEDGDDATVLDTMINRFTTLYVRQSFEITETVDATRRIQLVMDYDDGFIAWLDGVEIARSPNVAGAVGTEPSNTATSLAPNHEASAGPSGNPPTVIDLGLVGSRLEPGTHVLSIMGLNGAINSSDFSLIADLSLTGGSGAVGGGSFFTLVTSSPITMSGSNTFPGSTRVSINGVDAAFNPGNGTWSKTQSLLPGMNRLFIAALDAQGSILAATNRDVIFDAAGTTFGGVAATDTTLNTGRTVIRLTNNVTVSSGARLSVGPGAVLLLPANVSIRASANSSVDIAGSEADPVFIVPADGTTAWQELSATGSGAALNLRHTEIVAGQVRVLTSATVTLEDCVLRDIYARQMLEANRGLQMTIRRCHLNRFAQCHFDYTPTLIEDCLIENVTSDATDFEGFPAEIIVRRNTYRFGIGSNTDAVDTGLNQGLLVESCIIRDFGDKAVSIADDSPGTVIRNNLLLNSGDGISCYAAINCVFNQNTIVNCVSGVRVWERTAGQGAGQAVGTNNIIWGNAANVVLTEAGRFDASYSDIEGVSVYPGEGNINADPLFVAPASLDYRLASGSPAAGTGAGGVNMGVSSLVGGLPSAPFHLAALVSGNNPIQLTWQEDADNEAGFALQRSVDGAMWIDAGNFGPGVTNAMDSIALPDVLYFYRVRSTNSSGFSRYSNLASAIRTANTVVGGTLVTDTVWSPALGMIVVQSTVIVPANVTLSVLPGTIIKLTNNASIIAVGGTIDITGTPDNKVRLMPLVGTNLWGQLSAQFAGALTLRHADVARGQITIYSNAVGVLEDSYIHDYRRTGGTLYTTPIILTHFAAPMTIRRCHIREYHEVLLRNGVQLVEECLFENIHGDAIDFDSALSGSVLRWCSFRHGNSGNVDAVDVGPGDVPGSTDLRIENCLMYDFPFDKGVSVGDSGSSRGTIVSNCLIYACLSGVMAKDRCDVSVRNCTIVNNNWGLTNYNKVNPASPTGGGITTNSYNNILWGNGITISMANDGMLFADHNDFGGTNWTGTGNIDLDPLFVDAARRDYRLLPGSPCLDSGRDGESMGARLPVGAPMVPSNPSIAALNVAGGNAVLGFWADSEKSYSLECSPNASGGPWTSIASVPTNDVPRFLSVTNTVALDNRFYRLIAQ